MFSKRIFEAGFKAALEEELSRKGVSIKELAELADVPSATIYKITSGERDPRFSTVQAIVNALEPRESGFVAVIAAKFVLEEVELQKFEKCGKNIKIRGYPAYTMEECIVSAVHAEKDGALGIVCAPILSSIIEKIVDVPVAIMKPDTNTIFSALKTLQNRTD
ncbi:putative transcriptional regulator [Methanomicrobium sp. W14]|jgi:predicted transcriptional regulator|uniref:helix-turn-helix domain-containing protein n=1 Tax=Methanomicrobium sp. W14 TaxID=2817839 RepID=UPI001AE5B424|nr:helix-turn-helix domain-containing protein [Methanomicrobium sp. W14]MBP2133539.1 putative transcriptional regulator [Methanomicrobium sp. W14]